MEPFSSPITHCCPLVIGTQMGRETTGIVRLAEPEPPVFPGFESTTSAPCRSRAAYRPLELLAPGPRLSKATESTISRYCRSAVDGKGSKRVIRTERTPPEEFCFDAAQVRDTEIP